MMKTNRNHQGVLKKGLMLWSRGIPITIIIPLWLFGILK